MSVQVLGQQEVPTELVRHTLSFVVGCDNDNDPALWLSTTAVCQLWRALSHDLLRERAAFLLLRLPPPNPDAHCMRNPHKLQFQFSFRNGFVWLLISDETQEKEVGKEPTGEVLYLWRHDDHKPKVAPKVVTPQQYDDDDCDDGDWWSASANHQLVAISQAAALPLVSQHEKPGEEVEDDNPYYSSFSQAEQSTAGQVWRTKPWTNLFERFAQRGCPPQVRPRPTTRSRHVSLLWPAHASVVNYCRARWRRWCSSCCWPPTPARWWSSPRSVRAGIPSSPPTSRTSSSSLRSGPRLRPGFRGGGLLSQLPNTRRLAGHQARPFLASFVCTYGTPCAALGPDLFCLSASLEHQIATLP